MKNIYILIVGCIFVSCCSSQPNSVPLSYETVVKTVFNQNVIKSLQNIVTTFDSCIVEVNCTNDLDIESNYYKCFERVADSNSYMFLKDEIAISESQKVQQLISHLKEVDVFDEIFVEDHYIDRKTLDTVSTVLNLNYNGQFKVLIDSLSNNEVAYSQYVTDINFSEGYSPSTTAYFMSIYDDVDFSRDVNRLVFAVHYIAALSRVRYY